MGKSVYDRLGIPKRFRKKFFKTLGYYADESSVKKLEDYVNHYEEFAKNGAGLLIVCDDGITRSIIAAGLLREISDRHGVKGFLFKNTFASVDSLRASGVRGEKMESLAEKELLVINDFGLGINHEWYSAFILSILKDRFDNKKPTIVLTPFKPSYALEKYDFREKLTKEEHEDAPATLLNAHFYYPMSEEIIYYLSRATTLMEVRRPHEVADGREEENPL